MEVLLSLTIGHGWRMLPPTARLMAIFGMQMGHASQWYRMYPSQRIYSNPGVALLLRTAVLFHCRVFSCRKLRRARMCLAARAGLHSPAVS